ncbi:MAG: CPBP family intramembrane metalloprotease [Planctomycetota bacterium]|nr:CPBP family intramembrane metalloprotease [Planctomycetota bacterium]
MLLLISLPLLWWVKPHLHWRGVAWPFTGGQGVAVFLALMVAPAFGVWLVDGSVALFSSETAPHVDDARMLGAIASQLVAAWWLLRLRASRLSKEPDPRIEKPALSATRAALVGAVAIALIWPSLQVAGGLFGWLQQYWSGEQVPFLGHDELERMISGPKDGWFIASALYAIIAGPLAEEIVWRGSCQQAMHGLGVGATSAVVLTAGLFALAHWPVLAVGAEWSGFCLLFLLGLALGAVTERTGSLVASFVMHVIFNAANLAMALTVSADTIPSP